MVVQSASFADPRSLFTGALLALQANDKGLQEYYLDGLQRLYGIRVELPRVHEEAREHGRAARKARP